MDFESSAIPPPIPPPRMSVPPPVHEPPERVETPAWAKKLGALGPIALLVLAKIKTFGGLLLTGAKYLKFGKIFLTSGTMLLSAFYYSLFFGFPFAVGFVVTILIHELGHVGAAWLQGVPVSAPVFIPGMGALITTKGEAQSAYGDSIIGIGGPVAGTLAGIACWLIYAATGSPYFIALAYITLMLNLFNMTPIYPLDGGRVVGSVSPYLWLLGLIVMLAMVVTGTVRNPLLLIILITAVPRIWHGLKTGEAHSPGQLPATSNQKLIMGVAYVVLSGFLFWGVAATHDLARLALPHVAAR